MANIRKRSENSYVFSVDLGFDAKGKRLRRYKTHRISDKALLKTRKKLKDHLESEYHKFKAEVLSEEYIKPEKMLFSKFVVDWENKFAVKKLSETTLNKQLNHLQTHILPVIGHQQIDKIKKIHLIDLLDKTKRVDGLPLKSSTKEDIYKVLKSVFDRAVEWKVLKTTPVTGVPKPKIDDVEESSVYDEEEVASLFEAAINEPFHWRIYLMLSLAAGLRRSECLGLEWKHVDLEKGTLDITQVIVRGKSGSVIKTPKSKKSKRLVSIPSSVVEELKHYKLHWKKEKMKSRDMWIENEHEWLFCNEDGTHFYPTTPTTWWRRFTKRVNVRFIRLHYLRHTSATLLINQGVHAKIISERLGHSDIKVTMNTYGHALRKADHEAANKLDTLFIKKS